MSTTLLDVPLSEDTRERLKEIAARARRTEAEIAATLIEGVLAADQLESSSSATVSCRPTPAGRSRATRTCWRG